MGKQIQKRVNSMKISLCLTLLAKIPLIEIWRVTTAEPPFNVP
jgi:hypothetical protein